jgi:protein TonB
MQGSIPIAEHYEGGEEKLLQDIAAELQYPPMAKRNRRQGTCIIHVKLMEDGSFDHVKVVKNIGAGCGEEAMRVVKTLKFKAPGYVADYNIPVKFKL